MYEKKIKTVENRWKKQDKTMETERKINDMNCSC